MKNNFPISDNNDSTSVDQMVVKYTMKNGRNAGLSYNNNIYAMFINPSEQVKKEYNANRDWILNNFSKENC